MSDYTKRYIAFMAMISIALIGLFTTIVVQILQPPDPPAEPDINYKYCIENGGSYIKHDGYEYECRRG